MSTHVVSLDGFARDLRRLPKTAGRAMIRGLRSAALRTKAEVVIQIDHANPYPAVDRGTMRRSVGVDNHKDGALLSVDAPYAAAMEYGTRPFWPPMAPLIEWVKRKGMIGRVSKPKKDSALRPLKRREGEGDTAYQSRMDARADRAAVAKSMRASMSRALTTQADAQAWAIARMIRFKIAAHGIEPRHFFKKSMEKAPKFLRAEIDRELEKL